jgi:hypothetical protein
MRTAKQQEYDHQRYLRKKQEYAPVRAKYRQEHKEEMRQWHHEHYLKNKELHSQQARERHLYHKYKLTIEEFDALFREQSGMCAVCGDDLKPGKSTHVDHDHETGIIRGLLCHNCNRMLGYAQDDIEVLSKAITYLSHFKKGE